MKKEVIKELKSLLAYADKIKAITKTRFITELKKIKSDKTHLNNVLKFMLYELEGRNIEDIRKKINDRSENMLYYIDESERKIIKNLKKKIKRNFNVIADKNEHLVKILLKVLGKKINIVKLNRIKKFKHVDAALIYGKAIDSNGNIISNKSYNALIKKSKEFGFPIYCYTRLFNLVPKIKGKKTIKKNSIKSVISEIGIFDPEMFVEEVKLKYKWLFS